MTPTEHVEAWQRIQADKAASITRGRALIEAGANPPDQMSHLAMCDYLKSQREIARRYGCCGHEDETWITPMGKCVCAHTRDPCPRQALSLLLELFSILNRGEHEQTVSQSKRAARRKHYPKR
jgi:hypothetical protein